VVQETPRAPPVSRATATICGTSATTRRLLQSPEAASAISAEVLAPHCAWANPGEGTGPPWRSIRL
jgi:hypothetical protein